MRRCIPLWLLLILVLTTPATAYSQTRFFQRGDSGFTGSWGTFSEINNLGDYDKGYRVAYTYKGIFDLGIGIGLPINNRPFDEATKGLFGKVVLLRAREGADIGLEARGQYAVKTTNLYYHDPRFVKYDDSTFQTGVRGFFNHPFDSKFGMILGLSFYHRFNKHRILDINDEITFGHDYSELGFGSDFNFLLWGIAHVSLGLEYAQEKYFGEKWEFGGVFNIGVLIGRSSEPSGGHHE